MKKLLTIIAAVALIGCATTPEQAIQKKYSGKSTPQLQLRHTQLTQEIDAIRDKWDIKIGNPVAMAIMGNPRESKNHEKDEIESELLRRYHGGDKDAWLPIFRQ